MSDMQSDRALATLQGCALGDALGMPSQTLTRRDIATHYGKITDFAAPFDGHPVSHGLQAGAITDDTEQTLLLARRIIASPSEMDARGWAGDLLAWEAEVKERGLHDLLGPSSKAALQALLAGAPVEETGRTGTTNGAAMRIAPVAIATPPDDLAALVDQVENTCRVTHNTREAIASAAAVAAFISTGIQGGDFEAALSAALAAARLGAERGFAVGEDDLADRIAAAVALAGTGPSPEDFADATGTSVASHESVPAAFGLLVLGQGDPWRAACLAANIGDDTDTIGAIATAMAGSCKGTGALPQDKVRFVTEKNALQLSPIVRQLLDIRSARAGKFAAGWL